MTRSVRLGDRADIEPSLRRGVTPCDPHYIRRSLTAYVQAPPSAAARRAAIWPGRRLCSRDDFGGSFNPNVTFVTRPCPGRLLGHVERDDGHRVVKTRRAAGSPGAPLCQLRARWVVTPSACAACPCAGVIVAGSPRSTNCANAHAEDHPRHRRPADTTGTDAAKIGAARPASHSRPAPELPSRRPALRPSSARRAPIYARGPVPTTQRVHPDRLLPPPSRGCTARR